jgi:hypothetical protein
VAVARRGWRGFGPSTVTCVSTSGWEGRVLVLRRAGRWAGPRRAPHVCWTVFRIGCWPGVGLWSWGVAGQTKPELGVGPAVVTCVLTSAWGGCRCCAARAAGRAAGSAVSLGNRVVGARVLEKVFARWARGGFRCGLVALACPVRGTRRRGRHRRRDCLRLARRGGRRVRWLWRA